MTLAGPFDFTKGLQVMKIKAPGAVKNIQRVQQQTMLFDIENDPDQKRPIRDEAVEARMRAAIAALMDENDAPDELYERFGLQRHKS
jgi:chorismate mutase